MVKFSKHHTIGLLSLFLSVVGWIWSSGNFYLVSLLSTISLGVALLEFCHHILSQQKVTQVASSTSLQARLGMEEHNEGNFSFMYGFTNSVAHSLIRWGLGSNHSSLILPVNFQKTAKMALTSYATCRKLTSIHIYFRRNENLLI